MYVEINDVIQCVRNTWPASDERAKRILFQFGLQELRPLYIFDRISGDQIKIED